jgi:hypothetical protein
MCRALPGLAEVGRDVIAAGVVFMFQVFLPRKRNKCEISNFAAEEMENIGIGSMWKMATAYMYVRLVRKKAALRPEEVSKN